MQDLSSEVSSSTIEPISEESTLIRQLRAGEPHAFEQINTMYRSRLFRTALRIVRESRDAEDAVQETLIRAFTKIDTFDGRSKLYTWLTSILVNCCLVQLRRSRRHYALPLDETGEFGDAWSEMLVADTVKIDDALIVHERVSALRKVVHSLRPDLRFILTARNEQHLSLAEIASQMGLSIPATKSRARRAKQLCVRNVRLSLTSSKRIPTLNRHEQSVSFS